MLDKNENETAPEEKMILTNFKYNAIGGIDADRTLESGEIVEYTLTFKEQMELKENVSGSKKGAKSILDQLTKLSKFKSNRQRLIDTATVDANGFVFDADEISIIRLANAVLAAINEHDSYEMQWSLADTNTGVMTNLTLADLKLAHQLAVLNMSSVWGVKD
jgi:hypothetical protein